MGPAAIGRRSWGSPSAPRSEQEHLALLLMAIWALRTGRPLPPGTPADLSEDELVEFWADPALAPHTDTEPRTP
ncbi:hypothetical protein [Actinomadura kijaniata]|uniref:hypothetical protein n=1 Tax=Actinomadura kijaniata TaxID=46161 RepID=UPI000834D2A4|nr:hypothetical protein [Actinomadura kijaniata]